jgi:hypothetical protein
MKIDLEEYKKHAPGSFIMERPTEVKVVKSEKFLYHNPGMSEIEIGENSILYTTHGYPAYVASEEVIEAVGKQLSSMGLSCNVDKKAGRVDCKGEFSQPVNLSTLAKFFDFLTNADLKPGASKNAWERAEMATK